MRWPWQREIRSSNYTDAILTSLMSAASGGGAKTAIHTAALGQCAALYGAALAKLRAIGARPRYAGAGRVLAGVGGV